MERLCVVEASAGTGKTYFLEHRVVDLLLETTATIDQILVVTFTEKATAELRARIREKLAELSGTDLPEASRKKLRDALTGFDRAAIHTIHGFCQRLLVEDAFSGHRLFDQTQVPDEAAFAEAFHHTLRDQIAVEPSLQRVLGAYLDAGHTIAKLRGTLLACARKGAPVTPTLDPVHLVGTADRLCATMAALPRIGTSDTSPVEAALGKLSGSTRTAIAKKLIAMCTLLTATTGDSLDARAIAIAAALSKADNEEMLEFLVERADKVTAPTQSGAALWAAALALAAAHVPIAAVAASRFLTPVVERVRVTKTRRGQFDFQDMLRLLWDVLESDRGPELAARLRRRHPHAMIDEFQDTDDLQWKIFRRVWVEGETTTITIVGDPKQAIYSFRGADVHTYLEAREEIRARGGTVSALTDNYRSSPDLVAAVNAIIDGTHGAFFTGGIGPGAKVSAATDVGALPEQAPVHVFEIESHAPKTDWTGRVDTLAQRIADEAARLLASGMRVRDRHGVLTPLRPQDIHVLTRSGKQSDEIATALRARGVPCALYQREHLFSATEALELADLLGAIADPRERSARLRAWTTSFFAVPLAGLEDVMEVPDGHPLLALLHDWRGIALRQDWDSLFHRILEDTRWIERTLIAGAGERAVTNVLHLLELLHDELARSPCEVHELEARLRGWIRSGTIDRPDDLDIQRLETDRQAVQVMTIHRAKGLEAAVVFLFASGARSGGADDTHLYHDDDGERRVHVGSHHGRTTERIEADIIEENQRLMYVALTRAKVRLYLPVFKDMSIHDRSSIRAVHARLIGALAAGATDPESKRLFSCERIAAGSLAAPAPVEAAADLAGWTPPALPEAPADPAWDRIRASRGSILVTSYSRLRNAAARASGPDDVRGEEHSARSLAASELPGGASSGLFLHEVLEHVPFASAREDADWQAWARRADVAPAIDRAGRRHGISDEHRGAGARMLHASLRHEAALSAEVLPPLCDAPRIAREVEFTYPLQIPGGREAFARGYVDLLVGWDDRLWVVDYKSDAIEAQNAAEARPHVDRHYAQQSQLYAVAAARLLDLRDEADCRRRFGGVLYWFLRTNYVVDIAVSYDELARWTRDLAQAVVDGEAVAIQ